MIMITPAVPDPPELAQALWEGFDVANVGFDIGANCGQTLGLLTTLCDEVVAFEPAAEAFEYLTHHYGHIKSIHLSDRAVSSQDGTVELMAAPSKISTGQLVTHGTQGMEWSEDEMANGVVRELPSITLDTFANLTGFWPEFMKIDVEGHELEVLRGAHEILTIQRPQMLIEIHSKILGGQIVELLGDRYRIEIVRHPHYAWGSTLWESHFWLRCFPV
jgi:FkbM family methyltransferase